MSNKHFANKELQVTPNNNPITAFDFQGSSLSTLMDADNNPWFIAKDLSAILGYSDAEAMTRRLDEDEVQNLQIVGFNNRGINLINESGLYSSVLGSTKPEAKAFKKWVTSEVLPSIRKIGSYTLSNELKEVKIMLLEAKEETKAATKEATAAKDAYNLFFDNEDRLITRADFAKITQLRSTKALNEILKTEKIIVKSKTQRPMSKFSHWFKAVPEGEYQDYFGNIKTRFIYSLTPLGAYELSLYLIKKGYIKAIGYFINPDEYAEYADDDDSPF